jgi:tRNA(fMet)-specific endonuclease VapC
MYVLDTNTVSALMRHDPAPVARLASLSPSSVVVPEPVFAEIAYGVRRLTASKRKTKLQAELVRMRADLAALPWTRPVSEAFGDIKATLERQGIRLEDFDVAIAAHAVAHSAVLVTANVAQMSRVSDLLLETWDA